MATDSVCYLNGEYLPLEEAKISVLDRGFIFGDGVYDVVPIYGGKPFRWAEHMARLTSSMAKLSIEKPLSDAQFDGIAQTLAERNQSENQMVYFQVTRGVAPRDHAFPANAQATVFAMCNPFSRPSSDLIKNGIRTVSLPDERWLNCDIKSTSLLGNVLARQSAKEQQALECLMFRDGFLTEGSSSNIWVIRNNKVFAPAKDRRVLPGIRIGLMELLCQHQKISLEFRNITREEVHHADEILVSSATKELLPATLLDGQAVGSGKPGPVFKKLYASYQMAIRGELTS